MSIRENLKKELDKLQNARTDLIKENKQLKREKFSLEVVLSEGQVDFYNR